MRLFEVENIKPVKTPLVDISVDPLVTYVIIDLKKKQAECHEKIWFNPEITSDESFKIKKEYKVLTDRIAELQKNQYKEENLKENIKLLISIIKKRCSEYIGIFKHSGMLYRGQSNSFPAFESDSPNNRPPKDSNIDSTILYDSCLQELGIKALRSNSIFTSSSISQAKSYGNNIYVIFPEDTADYSWSEAGKDLILHSDSFNGLMSFSPEVIAALDNELDEIQTKIEEEKELISKSNDNEYNEKLSILQCYYKYLLDVRTTGNRIISFTGRKFLNYYFPESLLLTLNSIEYSRVNLNKFKKKYKPMDTNLQTAIIKKHEVLIHGKYIAVQIDLFDLFKGDM